MSHTQPQFGVIGTLGLRSELVSERYGKLCPLRNRDLPCHGIRRLLLLLENENVITPEERPRRERLRIERKKALHETPSICTVRDATPESKETLGALAEHFTADDVVQKNSSPWGPLIHAGAARVERCVIPTGNPKRLQLRPRESHKTVTVENVVNNVKMHVPAHEALTIALDRVSDKGYVRHSMTRPYSKNGCCTDRMWRDSRIADGPFPTAPRLDPSVYPDPCTEETCMKLPEGESCATCAHKKRCCAIFGAKPENTSCGFYPRRFQRTGEAPA